jgi:hypothetical protein
MTIYRATEKVALGGALAGVEEIARDSIQAKNRGSRARTGDWRRRKGVFARAEAEKTKLMN